MTDNASTGLEFSNTLIYLVKCSVNTSNQLFDIIELPSLNHCLHSRLLHNQRRHTQKIYSSAHHRNLSPLLQVGFCTSSSHVFRQHIHTLVAPLYETIMMRISIPSIARIFQYLRHIVRSIYPCIPVESRLVSFVFLSHHQVTYIREDKGS